MTDRLAFVKIDKAEDPQLAAKWRVRGIPTLILMTAEGTEIDRVGGYLPAKEFITSADDAAQGIGTLDDLVAQFKRYPDSVQLCMSIADKYREGWEDSVADVYYQQVIELDPGNESGLADAAAWAIAMAQFVQGEEKYDAAIEAFKLLVEKFPESRWAEESATYVPYIKSMQGKNAEAVALYQRFLENYPESGNRAFVLEQIEALGE